MAAEVKPLAEITARAINILCDEIGVANTLRFVNQFAAGYGNYTEERDRLFAGMTLDTIVTDIEAQAKPRKKRQARLKGHSRESA
ncbi:MAG: hypothetical protein FJZ95_01400 [Chloroflexi bacterium]|nr:hypothetical protein [Chloroflexota bacterium]